MLTGSIPGQSLIGYTTNPACRESGVVLLFIKTHSQSKIMNKTAMIPCRPISKRELVNRQCTVVLQSERGTLNVTYLA